MRTRHSFVVVFILWLGVACTSGDQAPATELLVRVSASSDVQSALSAVRIRTAGATTNGYVPRSERTFSASVLKWPIDLVLVPGNGLQPSQGLEIVVDALDASGQVLVQARVITSFVSEQARIVPVTLAACGALGLGQICEPDPDCHGPQCLTCVADECAPTPLVSSDQLPTLTPVDAGSSGADGSAGNGGSDGAIPLSEAGTAMARADGGGATPGGDAGAGSVTGDAATGSVAGDAATDSEVPDADLPDTGTTTTPPDAEADAGGCPAGFVADNGGCRDLCEGACDPVATCDATGRAPICSCPSDYLTTDSGKTCAFDSSCSLLNCDANATCAVSGSTRSCECKQGYSGTGTSCSNVNECNQTPAICGDNSTCSDTQGSYTCGCQANYRRIGDACVKNPCSPNPCQNSGTCSEPTTGTASCACPAGFSGQFCETNTSCTPNPCQNGGTCHPGNNTHTCTCQSGFTGDNCEAEICQGTVSIRSATDLQTYRNCAEITGDLQIATAGYAAITEQDFPYLAKVDGGLTISQFAGGAGGATTPLVASITLAKLQTIGGAFTAGGIPKGALVDLNLPSLVTVGAPGSTANTFTVGPAYIGSALFPSLTTVYGNAAIASVNSLCTVDFHRVTKITGNLGLALIPNVPLTSFSPLIQSAQGTVTENQVGCCFFSASQQANCDSASPTCGC